MTARRLLIGFTALAIASCIDFGAEFEQWQAQHDAGSSAGGRAGGATAGGSAGGMSGGQAGGTAGGDAGGNAGGAAGAMAGGSAGGMVVDAGPCGGAWCLFNQAGNGVFETTQGVFAASPTNAWITSYGSRVMHWNGANWVTITVNDFSVIGYSVWGTGPTDIFLGSDNGDTYRGPPFGPATQILGAGFDTLASIHGTSDGGSVYAGTLNGRLYVYDGGTWNFVDLGAAAPPSGAALRGVAVLAPDDVWVAGTAGIILHGDATGWTRMDAGVTENLRRAFAFGPDDVWFSGQSGRLVHWDGTSFTRTTCITCGDIWGLWGRGPGDLWLADHIGALIHFDGGEFSPSINPVPCVPHSTGLWGAGDRDLFMTVGFTDGGYGALHFKR